MIKQRINDYVQNSSLHGVAYINDSKRQKIERFDRRKMIAFG
jgi:hypothetical protein